jgi:hypothetical protein
VKNRHAASLAEDWFVVAWRTPTGARDCITVWRFYHESVIVQGRTARLMHNPQESGERGLARFHQGIVSNGLNGYWTAGMMMRASFGQEAAVHIFTGGSFSE